MTGYGTDMPIHKSEVLAYPGSFWPDDGIGDNLEQRSAGKDGAISPETPVSVCTGALSEGTENVLNAVLGTPVQKGAVALFVSHDAVIAPVLSYLTSGDPDQSEWIDFLDGFVLFREGGRWMVIDTQGNTHDASQPIRRIDARRRPIEGAEDQGSESKPPSHEAAVRQ